MGLVSFPQSFSGERSLVTRPTSQGDAGVTAPVEEERCNFCEAIATFRAQIGLFLRESFRAFLLPVAAALWGARGLYLIFLVRGQGG